MIYIEIHKPPYDLYYFNTSTTNNLKGVDIFGCHEFILKFSAKESGVRKMIYMAVCQNLVPLVNIKIAGKWMFIPLKMVLIGIDPYPYPDID